MNAASTFLNSGFVPFGGIGSTELIIFGIIAVLLIGKHIPGVWRLLRG